MVFSHNCSCGPCLTFIRNICISSVLKCNHYKALGLNSSATQAEIKSAYYELSKKHHPDKNQGSERSAQKFRNITEAYEVLGNEKSRRQYDREQLYMRKPESYGFQTSPRQDYNDELERMYYERRRGRMYYGKTQYYDFDTWYRAHYGRKSKYSGSWSRPHSSNESDKFRYTTDTRQARSNQDRFGLVSNLVTLISLTIWLKCFLLLLKEK